MCPLNAAICTTISYTLWVEWYYLKNNYLDLRSKVKVPQRSLWYATHRLMVMHPHTKYHWAISKDKNVMARTRKYYLKNNYLTLRSKVKVSRRSLQYAKHRLIVIPNIIDLSGKTINYGPDKLDWEEAEEAEEKIRLKQYVSLHSKGRHKYKLSNMNITNYEFFITGIPLCHLIIDIMCEQIKGKTSSIKEFITLFYYFIVTKCKWESNHILCETQSN